MNKLSFVFALCVFSGSFFAQNDPVVMTINDVPIKKSEFESVYHKNNNKGSTNSKSVKEYVDLFSLFKSKVLEAQSLGLDTISSFRTELAGYRKQLAAPYLTDKNTNESVLTEAYERLKTEVRVSHILVRVDESAFPKDTLEAWTRINLTRNAIMGKFPTPIDISNYEKLLKNSTEVSKMLKGKDSSMFKIKMSSVKSLEELYKSSDDKFHAIAPRSSDDPSVVDNKGDLNYFSAMDMVYPFECAAYNTKVGEISPIVRTRFGYHILKVYDRRPSRGEITVEHIMAKFPKNATDQEKANAKTKIDELKEKIKSGQNFEDMARQFSEDKTSGEKGGLLPPFKSGKWPKVFEDASFALQKNGDISEPVQTQYGWHIIKRVELKSLSEFESMKNELKVKVSRDSRSQMGRAALIARVKKENNFKENLANRDELAKNIDSTYLKGTWKVTNISKLGNKEIFNLSGKSYTQNMWAKYIETQMLFRSPTDVVELVKGMYKNWVEEQIVAFEDTQLEKKYPDFANLYREYRDGILLFDLTDQKVWSRAVKDSTGLKDYYEKNKDKYLWGERAEVSTYKCLNENIAKDVRKMLSDKKDEKQILEAINKTSQLNLSVENVTFLKGENKALDENWKVGISPKNYKDEKENKVLVILVNNILPQTPKKLNECRGNVTADFQSFLDTDWLNYLRGKYKVKVNDEVLNGIK